MHHEVGVIDEDPLGLLVAFNLVRIESQLLLEPEFHFVGNRLHLPGIASAANQEVIGERAGVFVEFENGNLFGFFVLARCNGLRHFLHKSVLFHN